MSLFKKRYTSEQLQILENEAVLDTFNEKFGKADWAVYNTFLRMQKKAQAFQEWQKATGQDVLFFDRHGQQIILKMNEDGTVNYTNNR